MLDTLQYTAEQLVSQFCTFQLEMAI